MQSSLVRRLLVASAIFASTVQAALLFSNNENNLVVPGAVINDYGQAIGRTRKLITKSRNSTGSVIPDPVIAASITQGPVIAGSAIPEPVIAGRIIPDPVISGGAIPEPVIAGRIIPEPVISGGAIPEPVIAGSIFPDPVIPGSIIPGPVIAGVGKAEPVLLIDPVSTNQNPSFERSDFANTISPTATPYLIPGAEVRSEVTTSPATNNAMYFSPQDLSHFMKPDPTTTKGVSTTTQATTPSKDATSSLPVGMKADVNKVVENGETTIVGITSTTVMPKLPITHNADDFDRKEKKPEVVTAAPVIFFGDEAAAKKGGKKKSDIPDADVKPEPKKGNGPNMDAKRVYDNVLKAYNSIRPKPGLCFSPSDLQKAFPKCKIMY